MSLTDNRSSTIKANGFANKLVAGAGGAAGAVAGGVFSGGAAAAGGAGAGATGASVMCGYDFTVEFNTDNAYCYYFYDKTGDYYSNNVFNTSYNHNTSYNSAGPALTHVQIRS